MASEQFSLCWDNFHKNMSSGMNSLLETEDLVDVTLAVQGKCLKAHKMVLSVCSPYFKELFKSNPCQHPIVFMKDVSYEALSDLLQFMYQGEVQVSQENLTTFIKTAEALQIKGLTGDGNGSTDNDITEVPVEKPQVEEYKTLPIPRPKKQLPPAPMSSPSVKRQRLSVSSNESQPIPPPVTKVEPVAPPQPVNIPTPEPAAVHFKMEPYDQSQNLLDETGDDNFADDNLDETVGDDTEDYSMMESAGGEEEPQAGTSADGAGEGQDLLYKSCGNQPVIVFDRFVFFLETAVPLAQLNIFWRCSMKRKKGCKYRFRLVDNKLEILKNLKHNHPPTFFGNLDEYSVEIINTRRVSKYSTLNLNKNPKFQRGRKEESKDIFSYLNLKWVAPSHFSSANDQPNSLHETFKEIQHNDNELPQEEYKIENNKNSSNMYVAQKNLNENNSSSLVRRNINNSNLTNSNPNKNGNTNVDGDFNIEQEVFDFNDIQIKTEPEDDIDISENSVM